MKHVFLTGSTGFLGEHVLHFLLKHNFEVTCLKRNTEPSSLKQSLALADVVIHCATSYGRKGESREAVFESNYEMPKRICQLLLDTSAKNFINFDSFFTDYYRGESLKNYVESKKLFREELKQNFSQEINCVNLQLFHIYGPGDNQQKFIPALLKRLAKNEEKIALTDGEQKRDFIYVNDVISALQTVMNNLQELNVYSSFQVGSGELSSLKKFIQTLKDETGSKSFLDFGALEKGIEEVPDVAADTTALNQLGWSPQHDLKAGIKDLVNKELRNRK